MAMDSPASNLSDLHKHSGNNALASPGWRADITAAIPNHLRPKARKPPNLTKAATTCSGSGSNKKKKENRNQSNSHSSGKSNGRTPITKDKSSGGKGRKRGTGKKNSRNQTPQQSSSDREQTDNRSDPGERFHFHKVLNDGQIDIIIDERFAALDFANQQNSSDSTWVLWTDGSVARHAARPVSPSSLPSLQSPPLSSSLESSQSSRPSFSSPTWAPAGASVVYEDRTKKEKWTCVGFSIAGISRSEVAEMYGLKEALDLVYSQAKDGHSLKKKIMIFTDSEKALRSLAKLFAGKPDDLSRIAAWSIHRLMRRGANLELRNVPGHMRVEGNQIADSVAKNATSCAFSLFNSQETEDGIRVVPLENPFQRNKI